jgi:hypothetical protein
MFGNIAGFMYILARGAAPSLSSSSTIFRWRRHVASGEIALGVLLAGMARGIAIAYITLAWIFYNGYSEQSRIDYGSSYYLWTCVRGVHKPYEKEMKDSSICPWLNNLAVFILAV